MTVSLCQPAQSSGNVEHIPRQVNYFQTPWQNHENFGDALRHPPSYQQHDAYKQSLPSQLRNGFERRSNVNWQDFPYNGKTDPQIVAMNHFQQQGHNLRRQVHSDFQHRNLNFNENPNGFFGESQLRFNKRQPESGRLLSDSAFSRISETLGAINTVGHYLVDMVDGKQEIDNTDAQLPHALYTISKNVLGRNVTDTIAPYVRRALPQVLPESEIPSSKVTFAHVDKAPDNRIIQELPPKVDDDAVKFCTTPEGKEGICDDLSNCPQLLLNLGNLRESLCFKSLFVPGVCCPVDGLLVNPLTTEKPTYLLPVPQTTTIQPSTKPPQSIMVLTTAKPRPTTKKPIILTTPKASTTTSKPIALSTSILPISSYKPATISNAFNFSNIVNPEDCGEREDEGGRVVGGDVSRSGAWPWMAAIYLHGNKRKEFWCGGSLVGSRHVLTAAHCTRDSKQRQFPARQFSVRLGDVDLASEAEASRPLTARVAAVRAHPRFSRQGFYNDIALLVLAEPVHKSKYVIPLCLPSPALRANTFEGSRPTVVGWGTTAYGGKESTTQVEAVLPVWRNDECDRAYFQPITASFICAGYTEGGVDACQGDSGGPLMLQVGGRWTQIGVVSFGNKCGEPGYPGVYTRLTEYLDWIQENISTT